MEENVSIILVNWNGWKDTIECIESLMNISYEKYHIIVVDNNSTNDSVEKIISYCAGDLSVSSKYLRYSSENKPVQCKLLDINEVKNMDVSSKLGYKSITLIQNCDNSGFAVGNNIGIEFALKYYKPEYVLLLNNDTVVDTDFLGQMIKISKIFSNKCLIGPKNLYYDNPDRIWLIGRKISWIPWNPGHNIMNSSTNKSEYEFVDFIPGSCILVPTNIFLEIGLLPTEYFLQWEDIDYCTRARKHNIPNIYVYSSVIYHKVSSSYDYKDVNDLQVRLSGRNNIIYFKKYLSSKKFILFLIINLIMVYPVKILILFLRSKNLRRVKAYVNGIIEGVQFKH